MRGRRAGENKWLNVRVGRKINQTRNIHVYSVRSTHPRKRQRLVVMHGTTATIRPLHASQNFAAIMKFYHEN